MHTKNHTNELKKLISKSLCLNGEQKAKLLASLPEFSEIISAALYRQLLQKEKEFRTYIAVALQNDTKNEHNRHLSEMIASNVGRAIKAEEKSITKGSAESLLTSLKEIK